MRAHQARKPAADLFKVLLVQFLGTVNKQAQPGKFSSQRHALFTRSTGLFSQRLQIILPADQERKGGSYAFQSPVLLLDKLQRHSLGSYG